MVLVFTDGAAKGNPGPGGWGVVIATPDGRVRELGGSTPHATNNQMELTAPIAALRALAAAAGPATVYADSTYVVRGITEWIHGWRRRGWKTAEGRPVLNRALWEQLDELARARGRGGVAWRHIRGHADLPGNERADAIASAFAAGRPLELYDGPRAEYPVDLDRLPDPAAPRPTAPRRSSSAPAYSYVSLVDGRPMRHATWAECERRVKGVSGVRFKKAASPDDEAAILTAWGCEPGQLPAKR